MRPCLKSVSLFTTTLLLSLTPSLLPRATTRVAPTLDLLLSASAQTSTTQNRQAEADSLFQEGVQQYRQGYYSKAVATYQRVLEIRQQLNDKAGIGQTLNNLGEVYNGLNQPAQALEVLQKALTIHQQLGDKAGIGETLDNIGTSYRLQNDNSKALDYHQQALTIRRELKNREGEGKTLSNIGLVYNFQKEYPKALELLQQALAIHQEVEDRFREGYTLLRIGIVYADLREFPRALEIYQQALALNRKLGNKDGEFRTLLNLGLLYDDQQDYTRVLEFRQQALVIAREIENKFLEAIILAGIGNAYFFQGKYEQAIEFQQQALTVARENPNNKSQEARILSSIGGAYYLQGNNDRSIEFHQQALAIHREIPDKPAQLETLILLSGIYSSTAISSVSRGVYPQAKAEYTRVIELAQEALILARELKIPKSEATALIHRGAAYSFFQDDRKAIEVLQQALSIARGIQDVDSEYSALTYLASIYHTQDDSRKYIEIRLRQLEIAREQNNQLGEADVLLTIAATYNNLGEHQKAVEIYQQGLAAARQIEITKLPLIRQDGALRTESLALSGLSLSYSNLGEYDKAIDWAQQLLKRAQNLGKPELQVKALLRLAFLYNVPLNDAPKALEVSQQALTIARQINEPPLEAEALASLSSAYNKQANYTLALQSAEQYLIIAKKLENPHLEQSALDVLQNIYSNQGNYQKAVEFAQARLAVVQKAKLNINEINALASLSESYRLLGDTTKAVETANQALTLARQRQNPFHEALALNVLSEAYRVQGEYEQGIEVAQLSLEISRKNKYFMGEVVAASNLSGMYEALGEYQKVIAVAEPGLAQARKINNRAQEAELLINLGNAYGIIGKYTEGKQLGEQGLAIARESKNRRLESYALARLSNRYSDLGEYQKTWDSLQQSLKIAQEINIPAAQTLPLIYLGIAYASLGDYQKSNESYQQALPILRKLKNRSDESLVLLFIAHNYFAQGNPQKTIEFAQQGVAIAEQIKDPRIQAFANILLSIGYGQLGDDKQAMEAAKTWLNFTRKVQNIVWEKQALTLVGHIHRKFERKEEAIEVYQQALAIKTDNQAPGADAGIYAGLAGIYRDLNQPNVAITHYKQSVNKIEEVRRGIEGLPQELQNSFLDATVDFDKVKVSDIYRQLAALLLSQGRDKEALQVQQLLREQEIREAVNPRDAARDKPNIPLTPTETKIPAQSESIIALAKQINECESTNCSKLRELNTRRTALINEFDQQLQKIDQEIRANRAKDDAFFDPNKLAKIQEIVEAQPGKVMIYPLVLEQELWIQLYASGGVVRSVKVNVGRDELGNAVKEFRDLMEECEKRAYCGSADTAKLQAVSQKLYNWLIKPLEEELQNNQVKHLVFALDRVTRYIPMSALHDGKQYLIEKYTVYNVLTEDTSNVNKSDRLSGDTQNTPILAMGVSDAIAGYNPLPNVPSELNAIVRQETTGNQGIYPGEKFLNDAFDFPTLQDNLRNFKILHLATHAVFVPDSADQSYILLGTGEKLTIPQIKTLTGLNNIHLVVLSACQTALAGPRQDGIEIASTAYHFLNRGTQSVIASLWLVNDASTSLLMQRFYNHLASDTSQQPMTKAEALRQAQLSMLQGKITAKDVPQRSIGAEPRLDLVATGGNSNSPDFSHPYYWAPFILIGNGL